MKQPQSGPQTCLIVIKVEQIFYLCVWQTNHVSLAWWPGAVSVWNNNNNNRRGETHDSLASIYHILSGETAQMVENVAPITIILPSQSNKQNWNINKIPPASIKPQHILVNSHSCWCYTTIFFYACKWIVGSGIFVFCCCSSSGSPHRSEMARLRIDCLFLVSKYLWLYVWESFPPSPIDQGLWTFCNIRPISI